MPSCRSARCFRGLRMTTSKNFIRCSLQRGDQMLFRRREEPEPKFTPEFFHNLERDITPAPALPTPSPERYAPPPKPRTMTQKMADLERMEARFNEAQHTMWDLADAKAELRREIMADLAADRERTEARLREIERLTVLFIEQEKTMEVRDEGTDM